MKKISKQQTAIKVYCYKGYQRRLLAVLLLLTFWAVVALLFYIGGTRVLWFLPLAAGIISPLLAGGLCLLINRIIFLKKITFVFKEEMGEITAGKKTYTILYSDVREVTYKNLLGGRLRLYIEDSDTALLFIETLRKGGAGTFLFDMGRGFIDGKQKGGGKIYAKKHI